MSEISEAKKFLSDKFSDFEMDIELGLDGGLAFEIADHIKAQAAKIEAMEKQLEIITNVVDRNSEKLGYI